MKEETTWRKYIWPALLHRAAINKNAFLWPLYDTIQYNTKCLYGSSVLKSWRILSLIYRSETNRKTGVEWVQALAGISRSCYVAIATKPKQCIDCKSAQLGATPYHPPNYIRVSAAVWACGRGQTHTDRRAWPLCISCRLWRTRNVVRKKRNY